MSDRKNICGFECEVKDGKVHAVYIDVEGQGTTKKYPYYWNSKTRVYDNRDLSISTFRKYIKYDEAHEENTLIFR